MRAKCEQISSGRRRKFRKSCHSQFLQKTTRGLRLRGLSRDLAQRCALPITLETRYDSRSAEQRLMRVFVIYSSLKAKASKKHSKEHKKARERYPSPEY